MLRGVIANENGNGGDHRENESESDDGCHGLHRSNDHGYRSHDHGHDHRKSVSRENGNESESGSDHGDGHHRNDEKEHSDDQNHVHDRGHCNDDGHWSVHVRDAQQLLQKWDGHCRNQVWAREQHQYERNQL